MLMLLTGVSCYWWGKIKTDRAWQADVTRRAGQAIDAPWFYAGEPILLNRPDAAQTIFRRNPYREDPSVNYLEAA